MSKLVIVHYNEIGLKGKNRGFFERKLADNIKRALRGTGYARVRRISGRLLVELDEDANLEEIQVRLPKVFGIAYFSLAHETQQDIAAIQEDALSLIQGRSFNTLKVETKRSNKDFPLTSPDINAQVGGYLLEHTGGRADLTNPDLTCFIEIVEKYAYIYTDKPKGAGGLPVGVSGKVVSLLSGGIDSPVASFMMMKRGARIVYVHFYSYPYTDKASLEKVKSLVEILNAYQYHSLLYLVPFVDIQKEIVAKTPTDFRVILYRRMMVRIAEAIASHERAQALVTGESLGQVASQTLANLRVISELAELPILRPLIGWDKQEIVNLAEQIGTFQTSVLPYSDCCSLFVPKHPATRASLERVKEAEENLDLEGLVKQAVEGVEVQKF